MQKYIIRLVDGKTLEIDGEPCLQEEYPSLQLFIGFYPCEDRGKNDCECPQAIEDCYMFRVCEAITGFSFHQALLPTKEDAIQAAKKIIEKVGIEKVEQIIQETVEYFKN